MAQYILHSIFHLARLLYVRPETFGPTLICNLYNVGEFDIRMRDETEIILCEMDGLCIKITLCRMPFSFLSFKLSVTALRITFTRISTGMKCVIGIFLFLGMDVMYVRIFLP